jgi:N-acylglucosamine 2-epimerase
MSGYNHEASLLGKLHPLVKFELRCVLGFWIDKSPDKENGGFYNCLSTLGKVLDTDKYVWLQGRQVYMLATVARSLGEDVLINLRRDKETIMDLADKASDFLDVNAFVEGSSGPRLPYFALTKAGVGRTFQRKIFSSCFMALGEAALVRAAAGDVELHRSRAKRLLDEVMALKRDSSVFNKLSPPGEPASRSLAVPMITLNLLSEYLAADLITIDEYGEQAAQCVSEIMLHVDSRRFTMLENVGPNGETLDGYFGRLMNPGHAIECGWFLLQHAVTTSDAALKETAEKIITANFDKGWDKEQKGLFYFLDSDGNTPTQLEWDMKLWWPHCESMIAFAMLYKETRKCEYLEKLAMVTDYSIKTFSTAKARGAGKAERDGLVEGEWYGYADRRGSVTVDFVGGPYKGCFHVPRALLFVYEILEELCPDERKAR